MWAYAWCRPLNLGTFLTILIITIQKCVYKRKCVWCVGVSEKVCDPRSQWRNMKYSFQTRCQSHKIILGYNRTCEIKVVPNLLHKSTGWMSGSVASYIPPPDSPCSQASFYSLSVFWGKMSSLTTSQPGSAPRDAENSPFYPGQASPDARDAEFN